MAIKLSKTVFIGLGGTGAKALLKTKAMMLENYGEIPSMFNFLVLDTDTRDKVTYRDSKGSIIGFSEGEFEHMTIPNVRTYVESNSEIARFLPPEILQKRASITEGAGQYRSAGRLALMSEISTTFKTKLQNTIKDVRDWSTARDPRFEVTDSPTKVIVVFSLAGGTGAGTFVDFPLVLKEFGGLEDGEKVIAVGLLPDVYSTLGLAAQNTKPNAMTGMTEYEFIADNYLENYTEPNFPGREQHSKGGVYKITNRLYDSFILVNNLSSNGFGYSSTNELTSFIGRSLYLMAGSVGGTANSALDNITAFGAGKTHKGKAQDYLGMGSAELYLDTDKLADYFALNQMSLLCQRIVSGSYTGNINLDIEEQITQWQIKEDNGDDHVISKITEKNSPRIPFSNIEEFDDDAHVTIKARRDTWIENEKSALQGVIYGPNNNGTLAQLTGDKLTLLQDFIDKKLNEEGGVAYSKLFLNNLVGRLNVMLSEMNSESESYDDKITNLQVQYASAVTNITAAQQIGKFNLFKSRSKEIEIACNDYVQLVNSEIVSIYEKQRRVAAASFFKAVIEKSKKLLTDIDNFQLQMDQLSQRVSSEIQQIKSRTTKDPFIIFVDKYAIEKNNIGKEELDVQGFVNHVNNLNTMVQGGFSVDELYVKFKAYTSGLSKYNELKSTGILDELGKLDYEVLVTLVNQLKDSIGIMRTTNTSDTPETVIINTLGVSNTDHPSLKLSDNFDEADGDDSKTKRVPKLIDAFNEHFKDHNGKNPEFSITSDRKRIIIGSYQSGVPAYVVGNFSSYKKEFERLSSEEQKMMFSNRYWADKIIGLNFSLFAKDDHNSMKSWALAIVATKVERDAGRPGALFLDKATGGNYWVNSPNGTIRNNTMMADLGASDRAKAYKLFTEMGLSNNLLEFVKKRIKENMSAYQSTLEHLANNPQVYLDEYSNHQLNSGTYNSPAYAETKKLVEEEYQFILKFANGNELSSL